MILCMTVALLAMAQHASVNLQSNHETLTSVLKKVEKMGEKNIIFSPEETDRYQVSLSIRRKTQKEALQIILKGKPFTMVEHNTYFAIQYTGKDKAVAQTKGKVLDENHRPLGYANVILLSAKDNSYVGGCVSADDGSFLLPFSPEGAKLQISYVGYKKMVVAAKADMTILLQPEAQMLKGVKVTSKRSEVSYKNGAFVANVAGTVLAEMGSAEEVIGHLPFVTGSEGSWNVIGRGKPEIYLNGRKITNTTELSLLDAKDILNAEVITVPGARYGSATNAVIRLRTVRKRGQGLSGNMLADYTQARQSPQTKENIHLNYRTGGLDIFGEVGTNYRKSLSTKNSDTWLTTNNEWRFADHSTSKTRGGNMRFQAGFNYETKNKQSFGARYETGRQMGNVSGVSWGQMESFCNGQLTEQTFTESRSFQKPHWAHELNTYYNGVFGKWELEFNGDFYANTNEGKQQAFNDGVMAAESESKEKSKLYATKLVASTILGHGQLSFGTEESFTDRKDDFLQSGYAEDAFNHIKQTVVAGFAEYYMPLGKKMEMGAGVRYEYQKTTYYKKGMLSESQSPSYNDWIPFFTIGYNHKGLSLGFAYRLNKNNPAYQMLQSSVSYENKNNYSTGDPLLKPQKQHYFGLNGSYKWLTFMAYYSYVQDMYRTWYKPYDAEAHPDVLLKTMAVVPHSWLAGASLRMAPKFGLWRPSLTVNVDFYHEDVAHLNIPIMGNDPKFTFKLDNSFSLPRKWFVNLTGNLSTRAAQGGAVRRCMGDMQLSISKKLLKNDALRIGFVARDMLHTGLTYWDLYGTQSRVQSSSYNNNQSINLNIRYTFNATKDKYKGKGAGQDERQRL